MARTPSYFGLDHSQPSRASFPNIPEAFGTSQPAFPTMSNSTNNAVTSLLCQGMYPETNPYLPSTCAQPEKTINPCQYDINSMMHRGASNAVGGPNVVFPLENLMTDPIERTRQGLQVSLSSTELDQMEELDKHLYDLPIESLLRLTQPEERMIKETGIKDQVYQEDDTRMHFKQESDMGQHLRVHMAQNDSSMHSPSLIASSPSLTTSSSCSPQSSPFSPHETSCSPLSTSFSPEAQMYSTQNITASQSMTSMSNYDQGNNTSGRFHNRQRLYLDQDDAEMRSVSDTFLPNCLIYTKNDNVPISRTPNKDVCKRKQQMVQKVPKKKNNAKLTPAAFTEWSGVHAGSINKNANGPDPLRQQGGIPENMETSSSSSSSTATFVPPPQPPVEVKKPSQPRKRMKASAIPPEEKICGVCGDMAKNMHFGGMACDSCKAFFRRSVQSRTHESFKCDQEENCVISKNNRRSCQFCRFKKCQSNGMQIGWVMTESDRMMLLKNRLAKTRQIQVEKEKDRTYGDLPHTLDTESAKILNKLVESLHFSFQSLPYPAECTGDNIDTLSNIFVFLCKIFMKFFSENEDFYQICAEDRAQLLKTGIAMSLYITGAHMYDSETQSWPHECVHESMKVPPVTLSTVQDLAGIPDAFTSVMRFYCEYESDLKDEVITVLMYLITFFIPEDPNFLEPVSVQKVQDKYKELLKQYLIARDGWQSMSGLYPKLLDGQNYLKDILKFHAVVDIKPTINHNELATNKVSYTQPMKNLINQIQEAFKRNFSMYSSVFNSNTVKCVEGSPASSSGEENMLVKRVNTSDSRYGRPLCTDMIITSPFQNLMEWDKAKPESMELLFETPSFRPAIEAGYPGEKVRRKSKDIVKCSESSSSQSLALIRKQDTQQTDPTDDVSIEAVCDILKQLSHTEDKKVLKILKKNISVELLEGFSKKLKD